MRQVIQSPRTGKLELAEVPAPAPGAGLVVVRNAYSVMSPGTEKMALEFARRSLVGKARSRPDLVSQVVRKLRHEGPLPTYRTVTTRLDDPQPLGYSCAGVVVDVGAGVEGFAPGDRVACAGAGHANHAEIVAVPENLVVRVPDGVALDQAAFATIGAIALQGVRIANPTLGEIAAVIGLGLIGQLAVQLLRANGCRVLGIDVDPERVKQGMALGAEWGASPDDDTTRWRDAEAGGYGADFALVTAASDSSAPIALAAELCRSRGRVSVVGATAMNLDRRAFYEKELELRMSMSYGPGRYDRNYEELGLDYPISHVRWTENRNLQAFLALVASGSVDPTRLDVRTTPFADAAAAYEELASGARRSLAVVFEYGEPSAADRSIALAAPRPKPTVDEVGVAFLGAGNYAKSILLPAVGACDRVRRVSVTTATGPSARRTAEKFGYGACSTDTAHVLADESVDLVFVATRHDSHAALAESALRAGKAVWLEKPVGLTADEVDRVAAAARESGSLLAVGYNRRFSSHARAVRAALAERGPLAIRYTVAAGPPPRGTWITDPAAGGGRWVGEVCHFVDLCSYLVGAPPSRVFARALGRDRGSDDSIVALVGFPDGSTAAIEYLALTDPGLPKERFEASAGGRTATCENYRTTTIGGRRAVKTLNQDKGQRSAVAEVVACVRAGRPSPFGIEEIVAVSRATFALEESVRTGRDLELRPPSEA